MFERFTERTRRVVVLSSEEARLLNHNYIGTEHILLGLIHEHEGAAARVLEAGGISLVEVRSQVEQIIGRGAHVPSGHIPFTPRAKKVLELSSREALQLGHNYIGPEHVLLGLIREGEGVAAQILVKLGQDLGVLKTLVIQAISGYRVSTPMLPLPSQPDSVEGSGVVVSSEAAGKFLTWYRVNILDTSQGISLAEDHPLRVLYGAINSLAASEPAVVPSLTTVEHTEATEQLGS